MPTTAELREAAPNVPCDTADTGGCGAPPGKPCILLNGPNAGKPRPAGYGPHAARLTAAKGWVARQGKVDELTRELARLTAESTDLARRVTEAAEDLAGAQHDLAEAAALHASDVAALEGLRAQIRTLEAKIVELTPKPAPPTVPEWVRPAGPGIARYEDLAGADLNARINAAKVRSLVSFPEGVFEQADFTQPADARIYGLVLWDRCAGLVGSGKGKTIIQLKPRSSTRVAKIPKQSGGFAGPGATGTTNPLKFVHAGQTTGPDDVRYAGLTFRGTDQPTYTVVDSPPDPQTGRGHNYHGLEFYNAGVVELEQVGVEGYPGSNGANPGETFHILFGGGDRQDVRARHVDVDGRHPVTGKSIGGSGIYHGGKTPKSVLNDVESHHMAFGWGLTHYQVTGGRSTYADVRARFNAGPFNWERCSAHTFELIGCDNLGSRAVAKPSAGYGAQPIFGVVDSDLGSVVINLRDVKVDDGTGTLVTPSKARPVLVVIHPNYWKSTQKQAARDIHVFDAAGVEHPDWLVVLTGYQLDGKAA